MFRGDERRPRPRSGRTRPRPRRPRRRVGGGHPDPAIERRVRRRGRPVATLAADGGDAVTGQLGSYTWRGGGSDSPWLPGTPIAVGAGEPLTVRIDGDVPVEAWAARRAPGGATSDIGAIPVGTGDGT